MVGPGNPLRAWVRRFPWLMQKTLVAALLITPNRLFALGEVDLAGSYRSLTRTSSHRLRFHPPLRRNDHAVSQQNRQRDTEEEGVEEIGFHDEGVVDDAADGDVVGEAVELVPFLATHLFDHGVGGGDGEGDHQHVAEEPEHNERAAPKVEGDGAEFPIAIKHDIGGQMGGAIKEREQAEQAALFQQPVPVEEFPQRSHQQREQQENER